MRFDELDYPDCGRCGAKKLNAYSARCDGDGNVKEVVCLACDDSERLARWRQDGRLTSKLTLSAALHARRPGGDPGWRTVDWSSECVRERVKAPDGFECEVWFGGLQAAVRATNERGLSAEIATLSGALTLTTYCLAGRCMVQVERGNDRVTLITAEDGSEPRMGVQGIDATEAGALDLLAAAQAAWLSGAVTMAPAPNVGMQ